jgi:hypothetical protein
LSAAALSAAALSAMSVVYTYPNAESAEHPTQTINTNGAYWVAIVYYSII